MPTANSALLLVDVQNDFCPGGALAVRDGDQALAEMAQHGAHLTSSEEILAGG